MHGPDSPSRTREGPDGYRLTRLRPARGNQFTTQSNDFDHLPDRDGLGPVHCSFGSHLEAQPHQATERQTPSLERLYLQIHRLKAQRFTHNR